MTRWTLLDYLLKEIGKDQIDTNNLARANSIENRQEGSLKNTKNDALVHTPQSFKLLSRVSKKLIKQTKN